MTLTKIWVEGHYLIFDKEASFDLYEPELVYKADEVRAVMTEIKNRVEQIEAEAMLTSDPLANLDNLGQKATEILALLTRVQEIAP